MEVDLRTACPSDGPSENSVNNVTSNMCADVSEYSASMQPQEPSLVSPNEASAVIEDSAVVPTEDVLPDVCTSHEKMLSKEQSSAAILTLSSQEPESLDMVNSELSSVTENSSSESSPTVCGSSSQEEPSEACINHVTSAPVTSSLVSTVAQSSSQTLIHAVTNGTSETVPKAPVANGVSANTTACDLHEVDLLDDVDSASSRAHLSLSPAESPSGDPVGACSPLSELSDEFPSGGSASLTDAMVSSAPTILPPVSSRGSVTALFNGDVAERKPQSGGRLDVEMEAQMFNLTDRVGVLTEEKKLLEERLKREQAETSRLCGENGRERSHIETLERQLTQQRLELDQQRDAAVAQLRQLQETSRAQELELNSRLSRTRAQFEAAQRDKDKMVLRYAQSEKAVIDTKKEAATADKRVKEAVKEKDILLSKVNHLVQERNRMSQQMEAKTQEAKTMTRDSGKMREEIESRDVRIKWLQNKMKQEADSYKEGQLRMETLLRELREAQETIRQYKLTEDTRSTALDRELREEKARRLVEEKLKQDSTHKERALTSQLQQQQERCSQLAQELAQAQERALSAEASLETAEAARARLQEESEALKSQVEALLHDSAELDEQRAELQRERDRSAAGEAEAAALQASQAELQADLDACHSKEADLLDFTQKLTEKNVELQSLLSGLQARAQAADFESREHSSRQSELETRLQDTAARLAREQEARNTDNQLLARRLAERTRQVEDLTKRAEDAENETAIVRKKHHSSVRELQRELAAARRRYASSDPSPAPTPADALSHASSSGSLPACGAAESEHQPPQTQPLTQQTQQQQQQPLPQVQVMGEIPDRPALIERIVRLQRQVARRNEKIDFLQDHNSVLVEELRRKSRLLQHYVLREETGTMTSQHMDQAKSELMRKGGIMASIYGSQSRDTAMTLELSLDINKKLQSVLEDTLLKNITLKDNMNVLGSEIATLTEENRKLKRH